MCVEIHTTKLYFHSIYSLGGYKKKLSFEAQGWPNPLQTKILPQISKKILTNLGPHYRLYD